MDNSKFAAGAFSGIVEVFLTHPLDFIKIKSQEFSQKNKSNKFCSYIKKASIKNFYSGIFPRLCGVIPMRLIFWGVQDNVKSLLAKNNINTNYNYLIIAFAGGTAQTLIDNQIEVIKIGTMTNSPKKEIFKSLISFRGFSSTLLRNIGFTSILSYFCFNKINDSDDNFTKFKYSALGGLIGSIITQPIDYVKTQKQRCNEERAIITILRDVIKVNPLKLYSGGLYRSILSLFTMGIGFTSYEVIKKIL